MTAGFGIPVGQVFEAIDPDECAKTYRGSARQTVSAASVAQLVEQLNVLAARCPRVLFCKQVPAASRGGTNWLWRWIVADYVQNASEHEFRALALMRESDPATGNAYWARLDNSLAEDSTCTGPEGGGVAPAWLTSQWYYGESATFVRTAANRAPADAMQQEGIICQNYHRVGGLVVQDVPLKSLDVEDHAYVAIPPSSGDLVIGGGVLEALRAKLHEIRSTNLPVVVSWAAIGDGADYATALADNEASEMGIHIASTDYLNVMMPNISAAKGWETRTATTPGFISHVYACGVGDPSTTAGSKIKVNCYVLAKATTENATVRFEGPDSIASNTTEISVTTAGGLDWYGSTSSSIYLDPTVANNDATTAMNKIDVCGKVAGATGDLWIYGLFAHVTYA